MKALSLPPGTYLVGDPASLVSQEVWEMSREIFENNNPDGKFISSRVVYEEHILAFIPAPAKQVWFEDTWSIPAKSGTIAVMPAGLVTADVPTLTKVTHKIDAGYKRVGAIETATTKHLIIEIDRDYFVVGEEAFDLRHPKEE